jgi:hypothetical protein
MDWLKRATLISAVVSISGIAWLDLSHSYGNLHTVFAGFGALTFVLIFTLAVRSIIRWKRGSQSN